MLSMPLLAFGSQKRRERSRDVRRIQRAISRRHDFTGPDSLRDLVEGRRNLMCRALSNLSPTRDPPSQFVAAIRWMLLRCGLAERRAARQS